MAGNRLLFLTNDLSAGGESTYVEELTKALRNNGFEIGCIVTEARGARFESLAGTFSFMADLSDKQLGPRKLAALVGAVRAFRPTFILCSARIGHYALPRLDRDVKPMAILHLDNGEFFRRASRFQNRVCAWVCPSPRLAEGMKAFLSPVNRERVRVLPHGIAPEQFIVAAQPFQMRKNDVLFAGVLYEHKGVHWVPEIASLGGDTLRRASLVFLGEGVLKESLELRCKELELPALFLGSLPRDAVAGAMGASKVFLFPTQVEGSPLVLMEAMMAGAVPVTTRLDGITDALIEDGKSGFLVPVGELRQFAERTVQLLSDEERWTAMSAAAQARAKEMYSLDAMVGRYLKLFAEPDSRPQQSARGWLGWTFEFLAQELKEGRVAGNLLSHLKAICSPGRSRRD